MNCEKAQHRMLLNQSGELSGFFRRGLDRHLERCAVCRAYRAQLQSLTDAVRQEPAPAPLAAWQRDPILGAARRQLNRERRQMHLPSREPWSVTWRPAVLYASLGVLLLTAFWLIVRPVLREDRWAQALPEPSATAVRETAAIMTETETEERLDGDLELLSSEITQWPDDWNVSQSAKNGDSLDDIALELIQLEASTI